MSNHEQQRIKGRLTAAVTCALLAWPWAAGAETLTEAVTAATRDNPEVRASVAQRQAADADVKASRSGYLPRVDLDAGAGRQRLDTAQSRALGLSGSQVTDRYAGLTITQMLFDGFGVQSDVERAGARADAAGWVSAATADDVALRTAAAYLEVLRRLETVDAANTNLRRHEAIFDQITKRADSGVGRRADVDQAQGRLALARSNLQLEQQALRDAEYAYVRLTGLAPRGLGKPTPPAAAWAAGDSKVIADALASHPSVRAAQASIAASEASYRATRAPLMPRVDFELSSVQDRNPVIDKTSENSAFLRLRWNLFRGFGDEARAEQAAYLINDAKEQLARTQRQIDENLRVSLNAWRSAGERNATLAEYVKAAEATRQAYATQFGIGQRTLLDLLNAENEFFGARVAQIGGEYALLASIYRVYAGQGALMRTLGVAAPVADPMAVKR